MVQRLDRPSRLSKECLFVGKMVHIAAADTASVGSRNASFQGSEQMSEVTARSGAPALPGPGWSHCVGVGGLVIAQGDHIFRWVPCVHFFFCALRQPLSWMWRHFSAGFGLNFWPCFFFGERWPKDERWLFGFFWPPFCSSCTHPPLTARSLGNWTRIKPPHSVCGPSGALCDPVGAGLQPPQAGYRRGVQVAPAGRHATREVHRTGAGGQGRRGFVVLVPLGDDWRLGFLRTAWAGGRHMCS